MNKALPVVVLLGAAAIAGCEKPPAPPQPPAHKTHWTAEDIAKDPQGYLLWSDRQVQAQIAERQQKLTGLAQRRKEFAEKRDVVRDQVEEYELIHKRLTAALERAEDEDRWPAQMAGRKFTREQALTIIRRCGELANELRPRLERYDGLLARMDQMEQTYRNDIRSLEHLREQLAIDLEQLRLTQASADVEQLRKAERQLESMSKALAAMGEDPLSLAAPPEPTRKLDIDEMLK
mgnify:CR=1 FL=1